MRASWSLKDTGTKEQENRALAGQAGWVGWARVQGHQAYVCWGGLDGGKRPCGASRSSPMNRMTGADGQAAWAALGTSPLPAPVRLLGWGPQGCCWPLAGVRLC